MKRFLSLVLSLSVLLGIVPLPVHAVESVIIESFNISFVSGATMTDGKYVWSPSSQANGHTFVYRLDYSLSGTFSKGKGALSFELPAHILKNRDGEWADSFSCSYKRDDLLSKGDEPDFVWKIDGDKAVIYNYKEYPSGKAGYIEFGYTLDAPVLDYVDKSQSLDVTGTLSAHGEGGTSTKEAVGPPVVLDTHASLISVMKSVPVLFERWPSYWGPKPDDAGDWLYLSWSVGSVIDKNTQPYKLELTDEFSSLHGSVVGYRFSGSDELTTVNWVDGQTSYGLRNDYVITRHSREEAEALLSSEGRYEVFNKVNVTLTPCDGVDESQTLSAVRSWWFESAKYVPPTGHFWAEKNGLDVRGNEVHSSESISSYDLTQFLDGFVDKLTDLRYSSYIEGYPYPWTLSDGADGTIDDAVLGRYGKKPVDYEFVDETLSLDGERLSTDDYDISDFRYSLVVQDAVFSEDEKKFRPTPVEDGYADFYGKLDGAWVKLFRATKDGMTAVDDRYVTGTKASRVQLVPGVKGLKVTTSNPYYHTRVYMWPGVTLYRTDHVLDTIGDSYKVRLENTATGTVSQKGTQIFGREVVGVDYLATSNREGEIWKQVESTKNDRVNHMITVSWSVYAGEVMTSGTSTVGIPQKSGRFYDLLPAGGVFDPGSLRVYANGHTLLSRSMYDVSYVDNYRDSGRTMVVVDIRQSTDERYEMTYDTLHPWESIQDYSTTIYNSTAYMTGNSSISSRAWNEIDRIADSKLMSGLVPNEENLCIYNDSWCKVDIMRAGSTGLMKQVRSEDDGSYSYETSTVQGGGYSYKVRYENDMSTRSKDLVFFDSLESFYQRDTDVSETIPSAWKGFLQSIDLAQMKARGVAPVVYLSSKDGLNMYGNHDIDDKSIWLEKSEFLKTHDLEDAHAVCVDASKRADGSDFVLEPGESLVFTLYMKAPESGVAVDSVTYNNIFMQRSVLKETGSVSQFFHQDYTQVRFRPTGDIVFRKANELDYSEVIEGAEFLLTGRSAYGTDYNLTAVSDAEGVVMFDDMEPGEYIIVETSSPADWQLSKDTYRAVVDSFGTVTMNCEKDGAGGYVFTDKVRVHADVEFLKTDALTGNPLSGAKFRLRGTSVYGNDVLLYAESVEGKVSFENIEQGEYSLMEMDAPEGYILDKVGWSVAIDDVGRLTISRGGVLVKTNANGYHVIANTKTSDVRFVKSSSYGDGYFLEGAAFRLTGVSDYGTEFDLTAVSGPEGDMGVVVFRDLEPGTYSLTEVEAPTGHARDNRAHTVIVEPSGRFSISGVGLTKIGSSDMYDFKNTKTDGRVHIIKHWQDDKTNEEREIPDITISAEMPRRNPNGFVARYDANGGQFPDGSVYNDVLHGASGAVINGTVMDAEPGPQEYMRFLGWFTDPVGGEEVTFADGIPSTGVTSDVTFYAHWRKMVRYAVSIWGIEHDVDRDGNPMGLTFGPAMGGDYRNSFIAHEPDGVTALGNEHRCLHDDLWQTVVSWNREDPYVYEQCIAAGCTKAIPLNFEGIGEPESSPPTYTGDGLAYVNVTPSDGTWSSLNYSNWNAATYSGGMATPEGGWGPCRLRAVFNGADDLTNSAYADADHYEPVANFTRDRCLLNCFPQVLQDAIGYKAVSYSTTEPSTWVPVAAVKTSYDKLWIPAVTECADAVMHYGKLKDYSLEGVKYEKFEDVGAVTIGSEDAESAKLWNGAGWYWFRTRRDNAPLMYYVNRSTNSGSPSTGYSSQMLPVVCFSLSR